MVIFIIFYVKTLGFFKLKERRKTKGEKVH